MFRTLRRRLRLIRYYSANRTRTAWSTATDVAMISAVALAVLIVWVMNTVGARHRIDAEVFGRTMIDPSGAFRAEIMDAERLQSPWVAGHTPMREFHLVKRFEDRGWPVTTTRIEHPPTLDRTLIVNRQTETNVPHSVGDPELVAIEKALRAKEFEHLADGWVNRNRHRDVLVAGWVFSWVLWCVMLWVVMLVGIRMTRLLVFTVVAKHQVRRVKLRRSNRCPHCGYDLRGLEFKERCPECGNLSW